jgi:hypothetical protein
MSVGEYEVGFLSDQPYSYKMSGVDYVVIHDVKYLEENEIQSLSGSTASLIIGPGVGYGLKELLQDIIGDDRIFDLSVDGCFELTF